MPTVVPIRWLVGDGRHRCPATVVDVERLDDLLAAHHGVLVGREHPTLLAYLSRRRAAGELIAVLPGVYVSPQGSRSVEVLALAAQRWRHQAYICEEAAARLTFWPELTPSVVALGGVRTRSRATGYVLSRRVTPPDLLVFLGDLRLTSPDLTALDLAVRTQGASIDRLLRSRRGTLAGMHAALRATSHRTGNPGRRQLLLDSRDEPWSMAERITHRILRAAHFSGWHANHRVSVRGRTYYLDIAFPGLRIAIEIDGRGFHASEAMFESDRARQDELVAAGWRVLRFTWAMLSTDENGVVRLIRRTLAQAQRARN